MKILAISCSPRRNGNTVAILEEALSGAREANADVELYSVSGNVPIGLTPNLTKEDCHAS